MAFRFAYMLNGRGEPLRKNISVGASQTLERGDLLALSSGKAVLGSAGGTANLGVATHDKTTTASPADTDVIEVIISPDAVFEVDYYGSTKTSLAKADIGTAFDIDADATKINLDDTIGGMCKVIDYDNDRDVAYVIITGRVFTA